MDDAIGVEVVQGFDLRYIIVRRGNIGERGIVII